MMRAGDERRHNELASEARIHGHEMEFIGLELQVPDQEEFDEGKMERLAKAAMERKKAEWSKQ